MRNALMDIPKTEFQDCFTKWSELPMGKALFNQIGTTFKDGHVVGQAVTAC